MFEEIRIKVAKNGFTVTVDNDVYVAPTPWSLSELVRTLIDTDFVPDRERKEKERKSKKQKL